MITYLLLLHSFLKEYYLTQARKSIQYVSLIPWYDRIWYQYSSSIIILSIISGIKPVKSIKTDIQITQIHINLIFVIFYFWHFWSETYCKQCVVHCISLVSLIGIVGNIFNIGVLIYHRKNSNFTPTFFTLLVILSIFDLLYLIIGIGIFGLPAISPWYTDNIYLKIIPTW